MLLAFLIDLITVQWEQNEGKCGVCGDAFNLRTRPHEAGGDYAKGIISRRYSTGQEIDIEIELTANHYGRFEMFLCPNNNPRNEATQECFDRYPLYIAGTREVGFQIPSDAKKQDVFNYKIQLPPYVTCTQCVMQWTYYTGNMWGRCDNGTESVGCGKPGEIFILSVCSPKLNLCTYPSPSQKPSVIVPTLVFCLMLEVASRQYSLEITTIPSYCTTEIYAHQKEIISIR